MSKGEHSKGGPYEKRRKHSEQFLAKRIGAGRRQRSLGVLIGIIIDDIGLGMMLGVAVGLCIDPAIGALKKNKKADEQENDDERQ